MWNNLCRIWSELGNHPDDPKAIAEARAHLSELLEHVDECEECRAISESMKDEAREAVFASLSQGGIALAKDELAILRAMDQVLADDLKAIDAGVEFLLAGLPAQLATPGELGGGTPLTSLEIFLCIDAVNMLIRSHASRRDGRSILLSNAGLRIDETLVSKREAIVGEISRHAKVMAAAADALWVWQLGVAEVCPTLYRGLEVSNVVNGELELKLQKSTSSADLVKRWRIQPKETLSPVQIRELVGEFFGIVRAWTWSIEPQLVSVVQELATAGDMTFKTVVDQITIENQEIEELMRSLKVEPIMYGDDPWSQIRDGDQINIVRTVKFAERRKRAYLYAISAADIDDAAIGLDIEPLKKYAAKSGRFDRNIKTLDRYESALIHGQTETGLFIKETASE